MPAYARFAAAIALAVSTAAFAAPVTAADLYEPPYDEYGEGPPPPDRYADVPDDFEPPYPPPAYAEARCVPREVARDRLRAAGCDVTVFAGDEISHNRTGGPTCLTRPLQRDPAIG